MAALRLEFSSVRETELSLLKQKVADKAEQHAFLERRLEAKWLQES